MRLSFKGKVKAPGQNTTPSPLVRSLTRSLGQSLARSLARARFSPPRGRNTFGPTKKLETLVALVNSMFMAPFKARKGEGPEAERKSFAVRSFARSLARARLSPPRTKHLRAYKISGKPLLKPPPATSPHQKKKSSPQTTTTTSVKMKDCRIMH